MKDLLLTTTQIIQIKADTWYGGKAPSDLNCSEVDLNIAQAQLAEVERNRLDRPEFREKIAGILKDYLSDEASYEYADQALPLFPTEEEIKREERERIAAVYTRYHDVLAPVELKKVMLEKGE